MLQFRKNKIMRLDLQWRASPRATLLHAIRLLANERPVIDHPIVSLVAPSIPALRRLGLNEPFWGQLLPMACRDVELSLLVDEALSRCQLDCSATEVSRLLNAAEQQVMRSDLDVTEELRLRQRPLRELWEASGPGMLFQIGRWTMRPIVSRLEVDGLLPLCGGFGQSFADFDRVQIELVLTNPAADVPEVIRLAWLIAQLSIPADADVAVNRLALVPCCLAAAAPLGLAVCQPRSLANSLRLWRLIDQGEEALGAALDQWWAAHDEDAPWSQAIEQLREVLMLPRQ